MDAQYTEWTRRWQAALDACQRKGGDATKDDATKLVIGPPASEEAVEAIEAELGAALPVSFRRVLTDFSASVDMYWFLPETATLPVAYREIFSGDCAWSLSRMPKIAQGYQG